MDAAHTVENLQLSKPIARPSPHNPCDCAVCKVTVRHWVCDACEGGPYDFQDRRPHGQRLVSDKGKVVGVRYACSPICVKQEYVAGLRDAYLRALDAGDVDGIKAASGALLHAGYTVGRTGDLTRINAE